MIILLRTKPFEFYIYLLKREHTETVNTITVESDQLYESWMQLKIHPD